MNNLKLILEDFEDEHGIPKEKKFNPHNYTDIDYDTKCKWFEKRFGRRPQDDEGYFEEWCSRISNGKFYNMDKQSKETFKEVTGFDPQVYIDWDRNKRKENESMDTKDKFDLISKIADKAREMYPSMVDTKMDLVMDLDFADQESPIDFEALLNASPSDFQHDIVGILKNFNRQTKKMDNGFSPRYSKTTKENKGDIKMENKMNAKTFLDSLTKLPERYQLILEGIEQTTTSKLIPQDLAVVLTKMTSNALQGSQTPVYVSKGRGKEYATGKQYDTISTEQRTANDWTVRNFGGEIETSQPIVAVYNTKNGENWVASTSKDNLKKFLGSSEAKKKDKKKDKKKMKEAFFKKEGEVNFESLANLKKELVGFGLKDGGDFKANLFGNTLELYLSYPENATPEQINDLVTRYGMGEIKAPSPEFQKEINIEKGSEGEEEIEHEEKVEEKKAVKKTKILPKPKLASAGKKTKKK